MPTPSRFLTLLSSVFLIASVTGPVVQAQAPSSAAPPTRRRRPCRLPSSRAMPRACDRAGRSGGQPDPHRRQAGRGGLRSDGVDRRLRPAGAQRRQAGHREDRVVGVLRRQQHLRLGALLGHAARPHGRQRDAARHQPAAPERHLRGAPRHLSRPPQRIPVLRQSDWRVRRQPDHR